jgi:pimeloyl-ACP methyl ester carboxylesterase
MEITLGALPTNHEQPPMPKFAWPLVLLHDLFAAPRHLAILAGYLVSIGWEVYVPDLRAAVATTGGNIARLSFAEAVGLFDGALAALPAGAIVFGHGFGGLLALKLAEKGHARAAVAIAPLIPGFRSPLFARFANTIASRLRRPLSPPTRRTLFELVADVEPFQREAIIQGLAPDSAAIAREIAAGEIRFADQIATPRLIVAGEADIFAPAERAAIFAAAIGARFVAIPGRGHWLIGGRALERTIAETQRFLVRALGQELLLLYPADTASGDPGNDDRDD